MTRSNYDRRKYCESRNKYKYCCRKYKSDLKRRRQERLENSVNSPFAFWKNIRYLQKSNTGVNSITKSQWLNHFKDVYSNNKILDSISVDETETVDDNNNCYTEVDQLILDGSTTEQEILHAINHLKNGKAAGHDDIIIEMIKSSKLEIMPFLMK